jgi:hypothetical protein
MVVFPPRPERLRAIRYGRMDRAHCLSELGFRGADHTRSARSVGIDAPIVLGKELRGVRFARVFGPERAPPILIDCRLALALDDLATLAADHGIVEIRYSSFHRPRRRGSGRGHSGGLAIDVNEFVRKDGVVLNVLHDFEGAGIGARTCGSDAARPKSDQALELRELVCAIDEAGSFNLLLTPHYDFRHRNHFHLEVRRHVGWFLTQ